MGAAERSYDEYRDDGWIWRGGARWRKWFKTIDGVRVWEPGLDLARIDRVREAARLKAEAAWRGPVTEAAARLRAHGPAVPISKPWILFSSREDDAPGVYSMGSAKDDGSVAPSEFGEWFLSVVTRSNQKWFRVTCMTRGFEIAIGLMLGVGSKSIARVEVNGRTWWMQQPRSRFGVERWRVLFAPEDTSFVVVSNGQAHRQQLK